MESSDGINIGPYFGAFVLGIYLNILLYGVVVAGYYHYAHHSKDDTLLLRSFILFLFFADTLHTGLSVVYVYDGLDPKIATVSVLAITSLSTCLVCLRTTCSMCAYILTRLVEKTQEGGMYVPLTNLRAVQSPLPQRHEV
ncbi:hypothetical protein FOMPIDRAFT_1053017 [Fomitopsis schrenkii]|uniref:Uncharacterized protein n=1 Tax=Fomitopsis schrenkii TaxID=2126942 RepID=S8F530_FOMSC|nr:hypothetical protein FOMPIDRAFT_1053017 [Fomitopsis schrenkii]